MRIMYESYCAVEILSLTRRMNNIQEQITLKCCQRGNGGTKTPRLSIEKCDATKKFLRQ